MAKIVTILVVVLAISGFAFYKFHGVLGNAGAHIPTSPSVKGASTSIFSPQVQETLNNLHKEVTQLSPKDISSSSPQVQAILQTLQQLPSGEAHDVCQKLCGSYLK